MSQQINQTSLNQSDPISADQSNPFSLNRSNPITGDQLCKTPLVHVHCACLLYKMKEFCHTVKGRQYCHDIFIPDQKKVSLNFIIL